MIHSLSGLYTHIILYYLYIHIHWHTHTHTHTLSLSLSHTHRHLKRGMIELGVHIADVSHFVKPGSLTDIEACNRSTSVYLADRRYDMLPPVLSAHLCSLLSNVDR